MFERRLALDGSTSPPIGGLAGSGRASTVADTDGERVSYTKSDLVC